MLLLDLVDEAFTTFNAAKLRPDSGNPVSVDTHVAAVVIFTCTLKEVLLERFLQRRMQSMNVPNGIRDRLFNDNHIHSRRIQKLFPSVVGQSWDDIVASLSKSSNFDYVAVSQFLKDLTDARNGLLHTANLLVLNDSLAVKCIKTIPNILSLFVLLHNTYVHPLRFHAPSP